MFAYVVTSFIGAFLLFEVELVVAKYVLPWYGGAPAVWTTCMVFFQLALLAGYAYAHWLIRGAGVRRQRAIHLALLAGGIAVLVVQSVAWGVPLLPDSSWKPSGVGDPVSAIVVLLLAAVGLPFLAMAATAPLVQGWMARTHPDRSPYRLYAVSNLGSLCGLLAFPLLAEPLLRLRTVAVAWAAGFAVFAAICSACAIRQASVGAGDTRASHRDLAADAARPGLATVALWLALPCAATVMLLAVTNQICQEVAVVPLLWVLPMVLYLGSFVLCFQHERVYQRGVFQPLLAAGAAVACLLLYHGVDVSVPLQIGGYSLVLFACCMACHGELARLAPGPRHLTAYYLVVASGGALGGLLVGVVAPMIFRGYWELHLGLAACCALAVLALIADRDSWLNAGRAWPAVVVVVGAALGTAALFASHAGPGRGAGGPVAPTFTSYALMALAALALLVLLHRRTRPSDRTPRRPVAGVACLALALSLLSLVLRAHLGAVQAAARTSMRDFFGAITVEESGAGDELGPAVYLRHGRIVHGFQFVDPDLRRLPTSYFGERSGVGLALRYHPRRAAASPADRSLRIGVVGLGIGTIAAYAKSGDVLRFYEISPAVIQLASGEGGAFTYLSDCPAQVTVVPGDGRISLERELQRGGAPRFDVLVMDAFSGAAVPVHLLTREAFATYVARLDPKHGVLAVNISNRNVDLRGVIRRLAEEFGLDAVQIETARSADGVQWHSLWALLTRDREFLRTPEIAAASRPLSSRAPAPLWTDDSSSLLSVLRW